MPGVIKSSLATCEGEGLAWAASSPELAVIWPSRKTGGEAPSTDAGEEVALSKSMKVIWLDIDNAPLVNFARRDVAGGDQVAQPLRRVGVKLVIVGACHVRPYALVG